MFLMIKGNFRYYLALISRSEAKKLKNFYPNLYNDEIPNDI